MQRFAQVKIDVLQFTGSGLKGALSNMDAYFVFMGTQYGFQVHPHASVRSIHVKFRVDVGGLHEEQIIQFGHAIDGEEFFNGIRELTCVDRAVLQICLRRSGSSWPEAPTPLEQTIIIDRDQAVTVTPWAAPKNAE